MNDKNVFIIYPNSPSSKYPTLKKSPESKKDIAFRLNFSSIKNQERNINHVMGTFEKPFATLGVNSELKKQFTQIIIDLKETFKLIDKDHSNNELNQKFWEQWNQFDVILHQMSVHSAYYYCSREIERLTLDITGAIKLIKSNPPAVPGIQHEFTVIVEKIQKSFVQIVDRFAEIVDSKIDESKKIRDLESMRNQIRQFRTDIVGERSKFFSLSSANHSTQEKAKQTIETSLNTIIAAISDLKRQTYLLDNLDNEITQAMRVIEMMIDGDPLPNAKSERITEKVTIEKENLIENQPVSPLLKSKSNISRRCTINPSNNGKKNNRRSSRRRKSIKRNASLIDLDRSASENESDASFCSTLSEFQDGKELLFDSSPINAGLSDIDEDSMFQISDDENEEYDNYKENNSLNCESSEKVNDDEDELKDENLSPDLNNESKNEENDINNISSSNPQLLEEESLDQLSDGENDNKEKDEIMNRSKITDTTLDEATTEKDNNAKDSGDDLNNIPCNHNGEEIPNTNYNDCDHTDDDNMVQDNSGNILNTANLSIEILEEELTTNYNSNKDYPVELQNKIIDKKLCNEKFEQLKNEEIRVDHSNENDIAEKAHATPPNSFPGISFANQSNLVGNQQQGNNESQSLNTSNPESNDKEKGDNTDFNKNLTNKTNNNNTTQIRRRTSSSSYRGRAKSISSTKLLPTSDESGEEFLSSDLEEINIPLVCSCPLITFEQVPVFYQLSTSDALSFEKVTDSEIQIEKRKEPTSNCYMMFLLVCFMIITFILLLGLHMQ